MTSSLEPLLALAGLAQIIIGIGHVGLPKQLAWNVDLAQSSDMTRPVSYVHAFFIGLTCVMFGAITLAFRHKLASGEYFVQAIDAGLALFWACRFVLQLAVFTKVLWTTSLNKLAHVGGLIVWATMASVYTAAALPSL
jgi:hypothetical protein